MKLADYVINFLADQGIDKIFVLYGSANGHLIDAFTRTNTAGEPKIGANSMMPPTRKITSSAGARWVEMVSCTVTTRRSP